MIQRTGGLSTGSVRSSRNSATEAMYANDIRDLEGLDRTDASPDNHPTWTALQALERDVLITIACLEQAHKPITAHQLKNALESWYPNLSHGDLHDALETLTANNFVKPTSPTTSDYHLTSTGQTCLETYRDHLTRILQPEAITLTLERPLTPGDLEELHCELEEAVHQ